MKRFTHTLNALYFPLIAAIAFATVVVAETENFAAPARTAPMPTTTVNMAPDAWLIARGVPSARRQAAAISLPAITAADVATIVLAEGYLAAATLAT